MLLVAYVFNAKFSALGNGLWYYFEVPPAPSFFLASATYNTSVSYYGIGFHSFIVTFCLFFAHNSRLAFLRAFEFGTALCVLLFLYISRWLAPIRRNHCAKEEKNSTRCRVVESCLHLRFTYLTRLVFQVLLTSLVSLVSTSHFDLLIDEVTDCRWVFVSKAVLQLVAISRIHEKMKTTISEVVIS